MSIRGFQFRRFCRTLACGGLGCAWVLFVAGCSKKVPEVPAGQHAAWLWNAYPLTDSMQLASLPCDVQPRTTLSISAPVSGRLRLYVNHQQCNLPSGFLWAEFEPKELQLEAAELAEARRNIEDRERLFQEVELPQQQMKLARQIAEAHQQVALLELLATNRDLAGLALTHAGMTANGVLPPASLEDARRELRLLQENLRWLNVTNPAAAAGVDLAAARMELDRRQLEFDRRRAASRFELPFAGQLILSLALADGVQEYPVSAGQELAVLRDLRSLLLRMPLEEVEWTTLPTEKMVAALSLPDGSRIVATYAYQKLELISGRETAVYYFQVPMEQSAAAARLVGTELSCDLRLNLGQRACIVPKLALVMYQPSAFEHRHWNEGIPQALPGSQLLVEGQTELAILPPLGVMDKLTRGPSENLHAALEPKAEP